VYSQATSKGATEETRERAERANVVRGSDQATVVAEEDTPARLTFEISKTRTSSRLEFELRAELDDAVWRDSVERRGRARIA
jgi:hypothetical protein